MNVKTFSTTFSTSEIMKQIADERLEIVCKAETFEPILFDNLTREFYSVPEDIEYWREYIWRYNNNLPSWKKIYEI